MSYNCVICYNTMIIEYDTIICIFCNDLIICENCSLNITNNSCPLCRKQDFRLKHDIIHVMCELDYFKQNSNVLDVVLKFSSCTKCTKCKCRMTFNEIYITNNVLCKKCNTNGVTIKNHLEKSILIEEKKQNKRFGLIKVAKCYI